MASTTPLSRALILKVPKAPDLPIKSFQGRPRLRGRPFSSGGGWSYPCRFGRLNRLLSSQTKLRVLMPCWEFPPAITGGLGVACEGLARELGFRVKLQVVSSDTGLSSYEGGYGGDLVARVEAFTRQVIASATTAELIHAHDWMSFPAAMELRRSGGVPFVAHVHSLESDRAGTAGSPWIRVIEAEGMRKAERVVTVSRYTAQMATQHYGVDPAKIRVVHNGIAPVKPWRAELMEPRVIFIGRMTSQKAPDVFLEIALRVADRLPGVRFVMAGQGEMLKVLQERVGRTEHRDRFQFPGFLDRATIQDLLARSSVCVMPSRSEPFGLVALEAAQFEVPTILSDHAGVHEVLRSNPVVGVGNVEAFASEVVELLCDESRRQGLAQAVREEASSASWAKAAEKVTRIYTELFR